MKLATVKFLPAEVAMSSNKPKYWQASTTASNVVSVLLPAPGLVGLTGAVMGSDGG